jgi:hypothetical protein
MRVQRGRMREMNEKLLSSIIGMDDHIQLESKLQSLRRLMQLQQ